MSQSAQAQFVPHDGLSEALDEATKSAKPEEQAIRGYRVRGSHRPVSTVDVKSRKDAINKVIAQSV